MEVRLARAQAVAHEWRVHTHRVHVLDAGVVDGLHCVADRLVKIVQQLDGRCFVVPAERVVVDRTVRRVRRQKRRVTQDVDLCVRSSVLAAGLAEDVRVNAGQLDGQSLEFPSCTCNSGVTIAQAYRSLDAFGHDIREPNVVTANGEAHHFGVARQGLILLLRNARIGGVGVDVVRDGTAACGEVGKRQRA